MQPVPIALYPLSGAPREDNLCPLSTGKLWWGPILSLVLQGENT